MLNVCVVKMIDVVKLGLTKRKITFRVHQHFHREMVKNILKGMEQEEEQALLRALKIFMISCKNTNKK